MMMKRIITLFLVLAMLAAQAGCAQSDIYVYSGKLDGGGRWFLAEMWGNTAKPIAGSYEYSRTEKVYVNSTLTSGEERYTYQRGTLVRIEYDGEMYLTSGMDAPIITNVYSVSLAPLVCTEDGLECYASYLTVPFDIQSKVHKKLCLIQADGEFEEHFFCITKAESLGDIEKILSVSNKEDKYISQKLEDHVDFSFYGDSFFEENVLFFLFFFSGATNEEFKINKAATKDGVFEIDIIETRSGGFFAGEQWLFLISLDRETANGITGYKITKIN